MVDVVYILGTGSKWQNNEIRYSLRSIEKYLLNYGNVFIVGEKPDFVQNVIHIPIADGVEDAASNIMAKIVYACASPLISKHFLCMQDDIFLLNYFVADKFPYYKDGSLYDLLLSTPIDNWYRKNILSTRDCLQNKSKKSDHFDTHVPIIYDKPSFVTVMSQYDWNAASYLIKSLYCNTLRIEGEQLADSKIRQRIGLDPAREFVKDKTIFSIGDECLRNTKFAKSAIPKLLQELYPNKSKYEK